MKLENHQKGKNLPWWGWLLFTVVVVAILVLPNYMFVTYSNSLDKLFFWYADVKQEDLVVGNYFMFEHTNPWADDPAKKILFAKKIGCGPGQMITKDPQLSFYCDGAPLGQALTEDSKGNPLKMAAIEGPVPEGMYFMTGDHTRSYDSKYYGLISGEEFVHRAIPMF